MLAAHPGTQNDSDPRMGWFILARINGVLGTVAVAVVTFLDKISTDSLQGRSVSGIVTGSSFSFYRRPDDLTHVPVRTRRIYRLVPLGDRSLIAAARWPADVVASSAWLRPGQQRWGLAVFAVVVDLDFSDGRQSD